MSWLEIDYDEDFWLEVPLRWTIGAVEPWEEDEDSRTPREWATETAELWWDEWDEDPGEGGIEVLADTLVGCVERYPKMFPGFEVLLYLPAPDSIPLPVFVSDFQSTGKEEPELRRVTLADDEKAIEKPIVEDFTTEFLGTGLRVLRYSVEDEKNVVLSSLRYAWRNEEHGRDVVVITASPAPAQILSALDDIDDLAHSIALRHNDYIAPETEGD
ncbi:hypothetical protein O3Q52_11695 [Streptomyces sp. ActVer]|uniref:hypothetical protein n=1 Tax=Streptomyces sp. ActVer TaxID=3014558 RepID=UPI0022B570A7|nr:hypothetical protein [Streptomyces sp. ActVer]MCZ4508855.1 hypothetical protein [Streptomyces sp. ActVer]